MSESRTSGRLVQAAINRAAIVKRRVEGESLRAIAEALEMSVSAVHSAIDTELKKLAASTREDVDMLRQIEDERLDKMLVGLWPKAVTGDVKSIDAVLRLMERRSKLFGLDQPVRIENTTQLNVNALTDRELAEQARILGIVVPAELIDPDPPLSLPFHSAG